MKLVAVTSRIGHDPKSGERRDCIDQRWIDFLSECGIMPLILPNHRETALWLLEQLPVQGAILTGGGGIARLGGDAPERDAVENIVLEWAEAERMPVAGICRGMQIIQNHFGVELQNVQGHVVEVSDIYLRDGTRRTVNSYHNFGSYGSVPDLTVWARAEDMVVKAIHHRNLPWIGAMWHPERMRPHAMEDVNLFRQHFAGAAI